MVITEFGRGYLLKAMGPGGNVARVLAPGGRTPKPVLSQPQCITASQVSLMPQLKKPKLGPREVVWSALGPHSWQGQGQD